MWYQRVFKSLSSAYFCCKNSRNDILNVNIIDSYVCMGGVDETNVLIPSYVVLWKTVFFFISDGCEDIFSHTFHVRNKYLRTHHPKPSPAFRMVRLRVLLIFSHVFFTLSIIIITYDTLSLQTRELDCSFLPSYQATIAHPPPRPKSG